MLKKNQRLTTKEIKLVFVDAQGVSGGDISLVYKKQKEEGENKFAFSVSSKAVGGAVDRNKVRRAGYEFIEKNKNKIKKTFHFVFIIKKDLSKTKKEMFNKKIDDLFLKANLLIS